MIRRLEDNFDNESGNGKINFLPCVNDYINKVKRRDQNTYNRIMSAIYHIRQDPDHSETLSGSLSGYRSKHAGEKVIIYRLRGKSVEICNIAPHDKAYGLR
ncbi:hypothetical protein M1293_03610 [Candidatus Parvarchaeota archaeon]|nr:hypothetical protein [Candidatus Parvarchaeota archaeon]